ncbi:MAG: transposase [Nannocystaceae bacterium]
MGGSRAESRGGRKSVRRWGIRGVGGGGGGFPDLSVETTRRLPDQRHRSGTPEPTRLLNGRRNCTWPLRGSRAAHIHCIVTGGGLSLDRERWVTTSPKFLFPLPVMSRPFRGKVLCGLRRALRRRELRLPDELLEPSRFDALVDTLFDTDWVVYAKRPFGGSENVYAYLGRYTHRVGLSNHRLRSIDDERVSFVGRHDSLVTLTHHQFIRRFVQHVLPADFVRLRHYGLLAPCNATTVLEVARGLLGQLPPEPVDDLCLARAHVSAHGCRPSSLLPLPSARGRARRILPSFPSRPALGGALRAAGHLMSIRPTSCACVVDRYGPELVPRFVVPARRLRSQHAPDRGIRTAPPGPRLGPCSAPPPKVTPDRWSVMGMGRQTTTQDPHRVGVPAVRLLGRRVASSLDPLSGGADHVGSHARPNAYSLSEMRPSRSRGRRHWLSAGSRGRIRRSHGELLAMC